MIPRDPQDATPTQIGPYKIIDPIAVGGTGILYRARHLHLSRDFALKLIADGVQNRDQAERVLREWKTHGQMIHPHIVRATDAGIYQGLPYLVTELVDGQDLQSIIDTLGPLDHLQLVQIAIQVCRGLSHAHALGIAHLDIKPANLVLDRNGQIRLADFGTAQVLPACGGPPSDQESPERLQATPAFMAPERWQQVIDQATQTTDAPSIDLFRSDLYSLGCTLYHLATGCLPDGGSSNDWSSTSPLQQTIQQLTAKDPDDRPANVSEVTDTLESLLDDSQESPKTLAELWQRLPDPSAGSSCSRSGQTIDLEDLVDQSPTTEIWSIPWAARTGFWRAGLLLVCILAGLMLWKPVHSFVLSTQNGPTATAKLTEELPLRLGISGFLPGAHRVTNTLQKMDPKVTTTSIEPIVPRSGATSLQWSPDGKFLIVQSHWNRFYVYALNESRLKFITVFRIQPQGLQRFCWHPTDGSLLMSSQSQLVKIRFGPQGQVHQTAMAPVDPHWGELLCCVADGDHTLVLFTSDDPATPCIGWDPDKNQSLKLPFFFPATSTRRNPIVGRVLAVSHDRQHLATQRLELLQIYRFQFSTGQWRCIPTQVGTLPSREPLWKLAWSQDDSCIVVGQQDSLAFHDSNDLSSALLDPLTVTVTERQASSKRVVLLGQKKNPALGWDVFELAKGCLSRTHLPVRIPSASKTQQSPSKSYRGAIGASYVYATMAAHPFKPWLVVATCGGLEIVDGQLDTVFEFPQLAPLGRPLTFQMHDASIMTRHDGGAVVLGANGRIIESISPPDINEYRTYSLYRKTLLEPEQLLLQWSGRADQPTRSTDLGQLKLGKPTDTQATVSLLGANGQLPSTSLSSTSQRSNSDLDRMSARIAFKTANSVDLSASWSADQLGVSANAMRVVGRAPQAGVVAFANRHQYTVFTQEEQTVGHPPSTGIRPAIDLSPSGELLYFATLMPDSTEALAIDWRNKRTVWTRDLPFRGYRFDIVSINDSTIALVWKDRIQAMNATSGKTIRTLNHRARYGLRHPDAHSHFAGQQMITWRAGVDIHGMASWSTELDLQWLALATGNQGGIVFASDGTILDSSGSDVTHSTRFVWFNKDNLRAIPPTKVWDPVDAFVVVGHHGDSQITVTPYRKILSLLQR